MTVIVPEILEISALLGVFALLVLLTAHVARYLDRRRRRRDWLRFRDAPRARHAGETRVVAASKAGVVLASDDEMMFLSDTPISPTDPVDPVDPMDSTFSMRALRDRKDEDTGLTGPEDSED
jgi:hypothetical protein